MVHRFFRPRTDPRIQTIWLTVYADLITNLVLVFLALYGLTIMGDDALREALQSMKISEVVTVKPETGPLDFESISDVLRQQLEISPDITISASAGIARIQLGENLLFESGRANMKSTADDVLSRISALLPLVPYTVVVEGHTDDVPLRSGGRFKDNRELALARAMAIVQQLIKQGVDPKQLAAAAYGPYRPRANNTTPAGRRLNRRVEIVFVRNYPYPPITVKPHG